MTVTQVFLVSLLFKKMKVRGRGRLFEGGACLLFWPRGWALIRGRALIRAWALIRGNAVSTGAHCEWRQHIRWVSVAWACFTYAMKIDIKTDLVICGKQNFSFCNRLAECHLSQVFR